MARIKPKASPFKPIKIQGYCHRQGKIMVERRAESKYAAKVIRESIKNMGYEVREA